MPTTEVEADAAAVDRYGYSNMLRALKTVLEAVPLTPAGASAMVASDLMSERVQALGGDHPRFIIRWRRLVASIAALVVLLTLGLAVPSATKTPPLVPVHRIVVPSRS